MSVSEGAVVRPPSLWPAYVLNSKYSSKLSLFPLVAVQLASFFCLRFYLAVLVDLRTVSFSGEAHFEILH